MRDIKFRGIDAYYATQDHYGSKLIMRYGSLITCDNGDLVIETNRKKYGSSGLGSKILPETLGQFTGLTDRNGVEIYESDVVTDHVGIGVVKYSDIRAAFKVCYKYGIAKWFLDYNLRGERESIEVIGNIHEHPKLLEER